jgi:hypothetical protein
MPEDRPDKEIIEDDIALDKWLVAYERRMAQEASERKSQKRKAKIPHKSMGIRQ